MMKFKNILVVSLSMVAIANAQNTIPYPPSWSFPDIVESARKVSPKNLVGMPFNALGLAYSIQELESIDLTAEAIDLQKYADVVTHAYPDAVGRTLPDSCTETPITEYNETSIAGIAYISIHAIEDSTRDRAETCLSAIQNKLK